MKKLLTTLIGLAGMISLNTSAVAQFSDPFNDDSNSLGGITDNAADESTSEIIVAATSIKAGDKFKVALKLSHPPKWHSYYFNDGIGISVIPSIKWTLPEGFTASEIKFPAPHEMDSFGLNSYGYDGVNYFITEITAPADLEAGTELAFKADAAWQICKIACIQEDASFDFSVTAADETAVNADFASKLGDYEAKHVPTLDVPDSFKIGADDENDTLTLTILSDGQLPDDLKFYEYDRQLDAQKPIKIETTDGKTTITGARNKGNDFSTDIPAKLDFIRGILYSESTPIAGDNHAIFLSFAWAEPAKPLTTTMAPVAAEESPDAANSPDNAETVTEPEFDTAGLDLDSKISIITLDRIDENGNVLNDNGEVIAPDELFTDANGNIINKAGDITGKKKQTTFLIAVLGIFGGGLILNLMPCVFPVLGVKVLGFVQLSGNDPKKIKLHGMIFALGVIVSMWILAAVILTLRETSGNAVAWGSQMKNPYFVGSMIILLTLFALNLFGVFEVGTSLTSAGGSLHAKKGYQGSFFSGILTTLIATPCGAPLLATAMTYTLQQTIFIALVLFTVFALGVAAPYLVLSFFPKLIDKLPRPGNWMVTFKKAMAFPLFATVAFLLMPYIKQTGDDGIILMIWSLVVLATAAFIYGTWSPPFIAKTKRYVVGYGLAIAFTVLGGYFGYQSMTKLPDEKANIIAATDDHGWVNWMPGIVDQTRSKKRIVWIDYTADW